ncbi:hypothetical protein [Micromonospora sp. NPDC092111]|uniref:hypothetical protein n=1 Tax=Micromonospora sp. NPDC092111 TaxID=3364289 RepID=UPI00382495BD
MSQAPDGGASLEVDAQNAAAKILPAISMNITLTPSAPHGFASAGNLGTVAKVQIDGDAFPDVEVVQYRRGEDPRFLAKSTHRYPGGAIWNLNPLAPDRHEVWVDGDAGTSSPGSDLRLTKKGCQILFAPWFCS